MEDYLANHHRTSKKFRTQAERRKYLKGLGIKFIKNPTTNEDMVAVEGDLQMLSGKRLAASRVKEQKHEAKEDAKDAFEKSKGAVDMSKNITRKACLTV